jgi:hypothetical protein
MGSDDRLSWQQSSRYGSNRGGGGGLFPEGSPRTTGRENCVVARSAGITTSLLILFLFPNFQLRGSRNAQSRKFCPEGANPFRPEATTPVTENHEFRIFARREGRRDVAGRSEAV